MASDRARVNRRLPARARARQPRAKKEGSRAWTIASRAQGEPDAPLTAEEAIELQRTVGNRATTAVVQRAVVQRDKGAGKPAESRWQVEALLAPYPVLARAMTFDQMRGWQEILDVFGRDEQVSAELAKYDWGEHIFFVDGKPQGDSAWVDRYEAIAAKRPAGYDGSKARVELNMDQILAPDVLGEQQWNVAAEHKYRQWLRAYLEQHPFVAEFTTRAEMVPGYLINSDETMAALSHGGVPHVALTWRGFTVSNTGGRVAWDDIKDWPDVKLEHEIQVTKSVAVWDLGVQIPPLWADINLMMFDHNDLIARSKKHPVVRWLSEEVSAPSGLELMLAKMKAEQNPDDEDAQGKYFAAQLKAAPMPGIEIWTAPREACDRAGMLLAEGKFELAAAVYNEADRLTQMAATRFNAYEDRVMEGAGTIVKWLNRAKTAGKVASMFTGAGGVMRTAAIAAGYTAVQEGSEQAVAHWIDPMNKIDVAGIAQQSAIEGLTALVGGLTQGAFVEAIATRYGSRLVAAGLSVKTARAVMSSGAAFTAGFYNTGARIVLDKVIAGKAVPSSVAELSDMVASEAFRSAAMDLGSGYVHALGAAKASTPAESGEEFTLDNPPTGPDAAPKEVVEGLARPAPHEDPVLEGPMAAGSPAGPVAGPTRATPEAYALAEQLAPLRAQWSQMSPAERLQALIDRIYDPLAPTGLPRPRSIFKDGQGGLFNPRQWELAVDGNLLHKAYPTIDEFASLAESTRHEMEHALQWFRIARRENRIGGRSEPLSVLADRLGIPLERAKAAQEANAGTRPAEDISPGSAADIQAQTHFQSIFDPIAGAQRNTVLAQLKPSVDAVIRAQGNLKWARANAGPNSPILAAAQAEFARALQVHQQIYAAYRSLPEEIAAWKAGEELKQAVLERETAKSLEQARLDLASAYDAFAPHEAFNEVAKASDGTLTRDEQRAFDKTFGTWVTAIHRVQSLEAKLAALTKVGP